MSVPPVSVLAGQDIEAEVARVPLAVAVNVGVLGAEEPPELLLTVTLTEPLVVVYPEVSVATADILCPALLAPEVFQE